FVCWTQISHLMESLKNVGATGGHGVIIRAFGEWQFATRAQRPFTADAEAAPNLDFSGCAEVAMAFETTHFFAFRIDITAARQVKVDRRFDMNLLHFRKSGL